MSLSTGSRIGAYEIVSALGAGGMGEVYRATDMHLKRQVAIKVLPASLAADPDRLARFQREAEVLAALNHPHIAAIYGLEKTPEFTALVMELVDGDDLSERIARPSTGAQGAPSGVEGRGPLPLDEALAIAKQIAEALEAAHEQGIIHRDLKPANIKVRADGTVKVLDFGLAKAVEGAGPAGRTGGTAAALENSPTLTSPALMTGAGVILGTAAYMAPEQARGRAVDKRADIWAFGVVLYEMVAGERLFRGEEVTDTLATVVRDQPDLTKAPREVRRLLGRCLEKDPKKRLRDLGDVWDLLDTASAAHSHESAAGSGRGQRPWIWATTALAATALAVGASVVAYRATRPVERPLIRVTDQLEPGISLASEMGPAVAIAPDGSRVAFVTSGADAVTHLSVRKLDEAKSTVLAGTDGAEAPFFSPDGRWIGFFTARTLRKISVDGGAAIAICEMPTGVRGGGFWADDGTIFVAGLTTPVLRVPATGGSPTPVTQLEAKNGAIEPSHRAAQLLPGGDAVLFEASPDRQTWEDATIEVQSLRTGERRTLVKGGYYGRYVPGSDPSRGHLVYMHGDTLFAAPMSTARLELTGPGVPILQNDVARRNTNGIAHLAVAPSGTLVYASGEQGADSMFWMDAEAHVEGLPVPPGSLYDRPRISPDGTRIAALTDATSGRLSVLELTTKRLTAIMTNVGPAPVVWSRDGRHLAVQLRQDAARSAGIYWTRADASIEPVLLVPGAFLQPGGLSPDGRRLLYARLRAVGEHEDAEGLWSVALDLADADHPTAQEPEPFLLPKVRVEQPAVSPDGRWVAYTSSESTTQGDVFVRPFPASGGRWQVSTSGGVHPRWSPNGRELLYLQGRTMMAVPYTVKGDTFVAGQPRPWSSSPVRWTSSTTGFDISPDGLRVLTTMPTTEAQGDQPPGLTFLFNFADELRRRVPLQ